MDVSTCSFSLFYQPVPTIRRAAFDLEDKLKDKGYVLPLQIYSIPEDAPLELPRMAATTEKGHTSLTVSPESAQVQSLYDEKYSRDFGKCLGYSKTRATELLDVLTAVPEIDFNFAGLSAQVITKESELGESPVSFISRSYLKVKSELHMSDSSAKFVYDVGEGFYLNIDVRKVILTGPTSFNITPSAVTVMRQDSASEPALSVAVDFNNRRAFNEGRKQVCDGKTVDELYSRVQSFLTSGLQDFLDKGEVRF
jgi:hypothetical protein